MLGANSCALTLPALVKRYGTPLVVAFVAFSSLAVWIVDDREAAVRQKQLIAAVHETFPEPVHYFDCCGMIGSFPKANEFLTSYGIEKYLMGSHDQETWLIIIAMAVCGALAQILLTSSLRFGSASVVLLMDYTSLLWAIWYGYTVFDRAPPSTLWLGAPLIIGAGLLIAYRERVLAKEKSG